MAKLGSREFFALLVLSMFVLSAVSAAAGSANFLKQKNTEKYFEKLSLQKKPSQAFAGISNFISKLPFFAKKTETTTTTTTQSSGFCAQSDTEDCSGKFCGWSSYGFCNDNSDCFLSQVYRECSSTYTYYGEGTGPQEVPECASGQKYGMGCGCLNHQCQWAKAGSWGSQNQGQGQGSGQGAGNGNNQNSQGQQGNGMGEAQSQSYGESSNG